MINNRRDFLKQCGAAAGLAVLGHASRSDAMQSAPAEESCGVLVDTTRCVGCRRCEKACNAINTDLPLRDEGFYRDETVFAQRRRMDDTAYTVVNRCGNGGNPSSPVYAKFQCMHCRDAACVSACIVGALTRDKSGAVRYDAWKCIGCRYCMQACPFQVPAYEYRNALTPQVRKCTFCYDTRLSKGQIPACVQSCPMEVMSFGPRSEMLSLARERIKNHPDRYVGHIYGEHEVGGTSWIYLSGIEFEQLGFPRLGYKPTPGYTEPIQHAIFKWFLPPIGLYAALGGAWWYMSKRRKHNEHAAEQA
jgi:Fe-S-cluster-containing dehydrogenase component